MNNREFKSGDVVYLKGNKMTAMVVAELFYLADSKGVLHGKEHARCYWLDSQNHLQSKDIPATVLSLKDF